MGGECGGSGLHGAGCPYYRKPMFDAALSLLMLCSIALVGGAVFLLRRGERLRPLLMLVLAAVMVANLVIWTMPTRQGRTLVETTRQ